MKQMPEILNFANPKSNTGLSNHYYYTDYNNTKNTHIKLHVI